MKAKNPAECIPHGSVDHTFSYCMFRSRWQDENDIVITFLGKRPRKHTKPHEIGPIWVTAYGKEYRWKSITGDIKHFAVATDGSAIVATADGKCLAVDFSGASGADAMLVLAGAGTAGASAKAADAGPPTIGGRKKKGKEKSKASVGQQLETATVTAGGTAYSFAFLTQGEKPAPEEVAGKLEVGQQTVSLKGGIIVLGKWAGE
jgi:hypothetical protein